LRKARLGDLPAPPNDEWVFSAHVGEAIPFEDKKAIEDVACYLVRAPLSLKKLVYLDGRQAVLYRSRMNPSLGRNFEAMDPLEWLARLADHIPDPGKHRTHSYGFYASRVRAWRREKEGSELAAEPAATKRCYAPSWARLIQQGVPRGSTDVPQVRGHLKIVAYVSDEISVKRILAALGLRPEEEKPPPIREVIRVPVDDEGREVRAI
jgi:hypothetical protein